MPDLAEREMRRNQALILTDYISFGIGMSFLGPTTLLPSIIRLLGGSPVAVGALGAIQSGAWLLPQLVIGRYVANRPLVKRWVVVPLAISRCCLGLIPLALFLFALRAPDWAVGLILLAVLFFNINDALGSVPWFDLMAKAVPPERRGQVMGSAQAVASFLGIGAGLIVERVLARPNAFPSSYTLLTLTGALICGICPIALGLIREPAGATNGPAQPAWGQYLPRLATILRSDARFAWLTALRWLTGLADMAAAFFVLYATDRLGVPQAMVGLFISASVLGTMLCGVILGPLGDRKGNILIIQVLIGLRCITPTLALLAPPAASLHPWVAPGMFILIFLFMGMTTTYMLGFYNYLLEIAPESERMTYISLSNTLGGVLLIAPLFAGWLVQATSYETLFLVALALAALGLLLSLRGPARQRAEQVVAGV